MTPVEIAKAKAQIARVLTAAAAVDQRTLGESDVEAWFGILGDDFDYDLAMEALQHHFRTSTDRLMPVHLIAYAENGGSDHDGFNHNWDGPAFGSEAAL